MSNLTEDRFLEGLNPAKNTRKSGPAAASTYYVGDVLMIGGDDGLVKHVSASAVANTAVVGFVDKQQAVASAGDNLQFVQGPLALSGSGWTGKEFNQIVFMNDDTTAFSAHAAGRLYAGRVIDFVSGSSIDNDVMIDCGSVVSGTVA